MAKNKVNSSENPAHKYWVIIYCYSSRGKLSCASLRFFKLDFVHAPLDLLQELIRFNVDIILSLSYLQKNPHDL